LPHGHVAILLDDLCSGIIVFGIKAVKENN